jgi:hypothetical protein
MNLEQQAKKYVGYIFPNEMVELVVFIMFIVVAYFVIRSNYNNNKLTLLKIKEIESKGIEV